MRHPLINSPGGEKVLSFSNSLQLDSPFPVGKSGSLFSPTLPPLISPSVAAYGSAGISPQVRPFAVHLEFPLMDVSPPPQVCLRKVRALPNDPFF